MDVLTVQWGWIGGYKTKAPSPIPPKPVIVAIEPRRWPGPSYIIYSDNFYFTKKWQLRKEDEEIIIL